MSHARGVKIFLSLCCVVLVLAIAIYVACRFLFLSAFHERGPDVKESSDSIGRYAAINEYGFAALPPSASNIWIASASQGLAGRCRVYRFDASYSDCKKFAQDVAAYRAGISTNTMEALFERIGEAKPFIFKFERYGFSHVDTWFDVALITNGWVHYGKTSSAIWIDEGRNRVYSLMSD